MRCSSKVAPSIGERGYNSEFVQEVILESGVPYRDTCFESQRVVLYSKIDNLKSIRDIVTNEAGEFPSNLLIEDTRKFCCRPSHTILYGYDLDFSERSLLKYPEYWKHRVAHFVNVPVIFRFWLLVCLWIFQLVYIGGVGLFGYNLLEKNPTDFIAQCVLLGLFGLMGISNVLLIVKEIQRLYKDEYIDIRFIKLSNAFIMTHPITIISSIREDNRRVWLNLN
jgi:hypothetical protein